MVGRTTTTVAFLAAGALVLASACQRARVDLDRPCENDGDCVAGFICNSGFCSNPNDTSCPGSAEVCDGIDNDCDGNIDEGFDCVLGGSEACGSDGTVRLCKSDCTLSACIAGWLDGAWPNRLLLTIDGDAVTNDFSEVAVPLRIPASSLGGGSLTTSDGRDVRITDTEGNLLRHQVESWDATRSYMVWVELSKLRQGEDRSVYLYVGNTHAKDASTTAIWDDSYVGVWHMAESADHAALADATAKQNATQGLATSPSLAVFGSGQAYDGAHGASAPQASVAAGSDLTVEGWFIPQEHAHPYRRTLTLNAPVNDVQALWPIPNDIVFRVHTAPDYAPLRVVDGEDLLPYTVLITDHGVELWVRNPQAGIQALALVYGQDGLADGSDGTSTFPFWAADSLWPTLFAEQPAATSSLTSNGFGLTNGRMSAEVPVDLRDGYLVQTYANYAQAGSEVRSSGGLPFISSAIAPTETLPGTSGVWLTRNPGPGGGGVRTSTGASSGFDQAVSQDVPFLTNDIGIGTYNNTASVFVDQILGRQVACAWANPLRYLLLGAYEGSAPYYFTNYIVMFVRRWPGTTPLISGSRERVGGVGIGDFAIGAQPGAIYSSTNASTDFVNLVGDPLQPHHVALVLRGTEALFYVDGEEQFALPANPHGPLQGFAVGDAFAVNGLLDEVRLSSTARSPELFALQVRSARSDFLSVGAAETLE